MPAFRGGKKGELSGTEGRGRRGAAGGATAELETCSTASGHRPGRHWASWEVVAENEIFRICLEKIVFRMSGA